MGKVKQKNHDEVRFLKGKIRELEKENRQLRRELQYHKKQEHMFNNQEQTTHEVEEESIADKKRIKCESCGKGYYNEFEILGKIIGTCETCGERKKLK